MIDIFTTSKTCIIQKYTKLISLINNFLTPVESSSVIHSGEDAAMGLIADRFGADTRNIFSN